MTKQLRTRFYVEAVLGTLSLIAFIATLINPTWLEALFGVDPDQGSGALEWGIVAALVVVTAVFYVLAGYEWRRLRAASV